MKILILSQFFTPEPGGKTLLFARALIERGHQVEVLTGFPNYPGGKVYPGYKIRAWQRETLQGVRINRVALYPSHNTSAVERILNYLSFALSAACFGPFLVSRPDVVYVYHPPPTIALAAMVLKFFLRSPFVYDIQDLWPDSVAVTGMMNRPAVLKAIGKWCSFIYRQASEIVVLSPGFRRVLSTRGVPPGKITVIPNWCEEGSGRDAPYDEKEARRLGFWGRFNVVFAGTMGRAQQLDAVLEAAEICSHRDPSIQFVFVGGGTDRSRLEAMARGRSNILFLPYRPSAEMPALFALADALLVHLKRDALFEITIPSKTQYYLAAGKPILMAVAGDAADMIRESGAGVLAEPGNAAQIAEAALQLAASGDEKLRAMGAAGRDYYFRELCMAKGVSRFEEVFARAV